MAIRRWTACLAVAVAGWSGPAAVHAAQEGRRPNVVVILADDLGYADIGAQGIAKDVQTPNIDSIASNGVRFTNAYVSCPVCSPSRAGLLTGRYGPRFGYELNPGGVNWPNFGLPAEERTLAEVMRAAGYRTGMMGKWHLGNTVERCPTSRGFEEFYGFWGGLHSYTQQSKGWNMIRRGLERADDHGYLTDALGREAAAFVDRHHAEPFFLYLAFNAIHQPMQAPAKYQDRFKGVAEGKRQTMLGMLSAMDDAVGQLMGKLREHKLEENTLIFFTSDNGGPTDGNASSNAPFSGYKSQLFEGGIREPFFVQWKGHVAAGKVNDQPVIALDIFATAAAVGGAQVPQDRVIDGVNLMPWLEGKQDGAVHERLYWRYQPQWAVREGNWKLMGVKDRAKLFNLAKDAGEKEDLSAEHPEVVKRLREAYAAWDKELAEPMWKPDGGWDMDEQEFDRQESPHVGHARRTGGKAAPAGGEDYGRMTGLNTAHALQASSLRSPCWSWDLLRAWS